MVALAARLGIPPRLVGGVLLGTLLNPLNSSMIAVALVEMQRHFDVGVATSTWLLSGFYLAAAIGQPLMGRLVDLFGARRLFVSGLALVLVVSVLAPFAPDFWWLVVLRAVQALGTSTAFPAALVIFRSAVAEGARPPSGALAALGVTAASSAALGPVIGGLLVAVAGWQAIFLVNVPLTIAGMLVAMAVLPAPRPPARSAAPDTPGLLARVDVPGIVLFASFVATLLVFLLSLAERPLWWLAPLTLLCGVVLIRRELRTPTPFLDVRGLASGGALTSILLQQVTVTFVFYSVFFGLPMWLEAVRGLPTAQVGPLLLPFTIMSLIVTPVAVRVIDRTGPRSVLLTGSLLVLLGTLLLQLLGDTTPIALLVLVTVVMGIPNGLNNLGLQTGLYAASPPESAGTAGGLFQTFRYLGAILAGSVLGILLERNLSSDGLHDVGLVIAIAAVGLVVLSLRLPRSLDRHDPGQ